MKLEKIRIHEATIDTRYGTDYYQLFDDPVSPMYQGWDAASALKKKSGYTEDADGNGFIHDTAADFEYHGFYDTEIPQSIVDRIRYDAEREFARKMVMEL